MIENHIRRYFPAYTPARLLAIRDGGDSSQFTDALLAEGSLEQIRPYAVSIRKVLQEKFVFLACRGTLKAIRMALAWVGFERVTFVRLSPTTFEVDPGRVPSELQIKAIIKALELAAPGRGTLTRIYHGDFEVKYG